MVARFRRSHKQEQESASPAGIETAPAVEIARTDPLYGYLINSGGPVELTDLNLSSAALEELRAAGISLLVPLINQGELLGTLNLGPRLSDQPYSTDDKRLLASLAAQVAPAVRVAQLVRQQEAEAKERERIEQELRVAALIQQTLLPKELPSPRGWQIDAYYRPARAVGGDFYDFIPFDDQRLGLVIGDVTDKGVPAALVMATTRSTIRGAATAQRSPGEVLAEVNEALVNEIPPAMFVTCLYGMLDTETGDLVFANAGHNLPYIRSDGGVAELRATGMPLGLMEGMRYDELRTRLGPGSSMVLSSDGIVEAHGPDGSMFGFPRLMELVGSFDHDIINRLVGELDRFVGPGAEPEDDVTLVAVTRAASAAEAARSFANMRTVLDFTLPSEEGNERVAMARVAEAVAPLGLPPDRVERLKTAVAEATMNAIEHGNESRPELPVEISVLTDDHCLLVRIRDQGGGRPLTEQPLPNLDAKLAGLQSPRGWGLFLIGQMVDELRTESDEHHHTIELEMTIGGSSKGGE
jgi:serine phosphatase RsbU (regulator of sigma subunit)/anti-sigma regulatory factor (Ser/Thr protein kinase)